MERIYLDHAATTAPDPRVIEAMMPMYTKFWGNASSIYLEGQEAHRALDSARKICADLLAAAPKEIVFTSGGSESDNAAIRGAAFAQRARARALGEGSTTDGSVVGFAATAREDDFFGRGGEEVGADFSRRIERAVRFLAFEVDAGSVAPELGVHRHHGFDDARIGGRRSGVVEINPFHGHSRLAPFGYPAAVTCYVDGRRTVALYFC